MKFVLVPLLIVAMFISFAAALIAMLFFTETVKKPEQLVQLWEGADSTRLRDEFRPIGFSIDSLLTLGKEYNALYEEKLEQLQEREDSLAQVKVELATRGDSRGGASYGRRSEDVGRRYAERDWRIRKGIGRVDQAGRCLQRKRTAAQTHQVQTRRIKLRSVGGAWSVCRFWPHRVAGRTRA